MDIPTFGALLRFAAELEEEHELAYQKAAETGAAGVKEALLELSLQNKKSLSLVQKLYRDSIRSDMDIGFQEPIPGLNRADYLDENGPPQTAGPAFLKIARRLEERARKFYQDASPQTRGRWPSVARSLDKLAGEKAERITRLESLTK